MKKDVSIPKTVFLSKNDITVERVTRLFEELGTPVIVKEPSTSFSLRVEKVNDISGFFQVARRFIRLSDWIVAQQYIESTYDWRVGVLDGSLLYACKYTIPSVTFKIQASVNGHIVYCGVESVPESAIPPHVVRLGIEAADAIGNGLYGALPRERRRRPLSGCVREDCNPSFYCVIPYDTGLAYPRRGCLPAVRGALLH